MIHRGPADVIALDSGLLAPWPSSLRAVRVMWLEARLRRTRAKVRTWEPGKGIADSETEEARAAHAELRGAPVDLIYQALRQVDVHPLRWIGGRHTDHEKGDWIAAPGKRDPLNRRRLGKRLAVFGQRINRLCQ